MLSTLAFLALHGDLQISSRWFYMQTNLAVEDNVLNVIHVMDRAHEAGYNGMVLTDSKFGILDRMSKNYYANAERVRKKAEAFGIEIIPVVADMGWSSSLLAHNVNLIEGQPVKKESMIVKDGTLQPIQGIGLANGSMESSKGDRLDGYVFQDGPGTVSFVDTHIKHKGAQSVRFENFKASNGSGNARLMHGLQVKPWQQYRVHLWLKTEGVKNPGDLRCFAMGEGGKVLSFMDLGAKATQDWTQHTIIFNSQEFEKVTLYVGLWGGTEGTFWMDDLSIEAPGFLNVLRRPGTPVVVEDDNGKQLEEGKDFDTVVDPNLGQKPWAGEYTFDQPNPIIKTRLPEGTKVFASFAHAVATESGKTAICPSEPRTMEIVADQMQRVSDLFHSKSFFLAHDEIRVANQCPLCRSRSLSPGQIYAQNIAQCVASAHKILPSAKIYVWSDMFDPAHNAVDNYYLSNGTWKESWKGLSSDVTVVNWNSGKATKSLPFFDSLGCKQILAGYYDAPVSEFTKWRAVASGIKGFDGVMYTTWVGDYTNLEEFAKVAFGRTTR